jgi:hypothetical protein
LETSAGAENSGVLPLKLWTQNENKDIDEVHGLTEAPEHLFLVEGAPHLKVWI